MPFDNDCRATCIRIIHLLRSEREERGVTKYALAQRSGLSQQAIGYLEREEKMPSLETIVRYAAGLEVDLADIVRRAMNEGSMRRRK